MRLDTLERAELMYEIVWRKISLGSSLTWYNEGTLICAVISHEVTWKQNVTMLLVKPYKVLKLVVFVPLCASDTAIISSAS
mmetsp:Transcript_9825/g.12165  ORF Transcript_9825/g.12165 Transcript_9825/m.12165 type:complete len:81 (+) Transcript_9825:123-365(+)